MIKLYFANLQKYNEGFLDGKWYDLEDYTDIDTLMRDVKIGVLHQNLDEDGEPFFEYGASQEEWAIHDYEAPFKVSEYEGCDTIASMITFCSLDEDKQAKAVYLYNNGFWGTLTEAIEHTDDVIFYKDMTLEDVAESLVDDGCFGEIPKALEYYIDYKALACDLGYDGYDERSDGVYVVC